MYSLAPQVRTFFEIEVESGFRDESTRCGRKEPSVLVYMGMSLGSADPVRDYVNGQNIRAQGRLVT